MQNCSMNILHEQISVWVFVMSFHSIREFWIFMMSNWPSQSHGGFFSVPLLDDLTFINYFCPKKISSLDWKDQSDWPEVVFLKHILLQKAATIHQPKAGVKPWHLVTPAVKSSFS